MAKPGKGYSRNDARVKAQLAIQARMAGLSYSAIAERVGYATEGSAFNALTKELGRMMADHREQYVDVEVRRLDLMTEKLWPKILQGNEDSMKLALQIMDKRMRLYGISGGSLISIGKVETKAPGLGDENAKTALQAYADFSDPLPLEAAVDYLEAEWTEAGDEAAA